MKFIFLLLFPFTAFAQRHTVSDTTYTINDAGKFFSVREVLYSTNEATTEKTIIGDTVAYFNATFARFQNEAERMAQAARTVFDFGKRLTVLKKENDKVLLATGKDALDTITARLSASFLSGQWTIRDTSVKDIAFSVNGNGQFRYQITGQLTRNADLYGDAITLNNYLSTGKDLFLFKTRSNNYRNREGTIILRMPGGAQNRGWSSGPDQMGERIFTEVIKIEPIFVPEKPVKKRSKKAKKQ